MLGCCAAPTPTAFTLYKKNHSMHVCDLEYTYNLGAREQCHISP